MCSLDERVETARMLSLHCKTFGRAIHHQSHTCETPANIALTRQPLRPYGWCCDPSAPHPYACHMERAAMQTATRPLGRGERAPDFVLACQDGRPTRFYAHAGGRPAVLLFYDAEDVDELLRFAEALTDGADSAVSLFAVQRATRRCPRRFSPDVRATSWSLQTPRGQCEPRIVRARLTRPPSLCSIPTCGCLRRSSCRTLGPRRTRSWLSSTPACPDRSPGDHDPGAGAPDPLRA